MDTEKMIKQLIAYVNIREFRSIAQELDIEIDELISRSDYAIAIVNALIPKGRNSAVDARPKVCAKAKVEASRPKVEASIPSRPKVDVKSTSRKQIQQKIVDLMQEYEHDLSMLVEEMANL